MCKCFKFENTFTIVIIIFQSDIVNILPKIVILDLYLCFDLEQSESYKLIEI